jgi:hypothetical protein
MFVLGLPLLIVAFAIYNIVAFVTPGVSWTAHHMMSGRDWVLTWEESSSPSPSCCLPSK